MSPLGTSANSCPRVPAPGGGGSDDDDACGPGIEATVQLTD